MIRSHVTSLRAALMVADLFSAVALFWLLAQVRFGPDIWEEAVAAAIGTPWLAASAYAAVWVLVLWLRGLYRLRARWSLRREAADIIEAAVLVAVATFAVLFLAQRGDVSRLFLLTLFPAQAVLTLGSRWLLRLAFESVRVRGGNARFVLVVGVGQPAQDFADRIEAHPALGLRVIGHLAEPAARVGGVGRPILGGVDDLVDVLHANVVDEVAICLPASAWEMVEPITAICAAEGRIVRIPMDAFWMPLERGIVEEFDGRAVVSFVHGPDRALGLVVKRVMDIGLAAVGLIVLSPLILGIALAIRVRDGAPVSFRQRRVGLQGRIFTLLKFRTMVTDAERRRADLLELNEIEGRAFKLSDDPRLTRTGRFLRRTSLDELPQLWNVLRGEMSLVGPRPPLPEEVAGYDQWHRRRLSMKPGMTGLWQVEGRREPTFDRWVALDLDYIDRWSLRLDMVILLRTIPVIIAQEGR